MNGSFRGKCELCKKEEAEYNFGLFEYICPSCQKIAEKVLQRYAQWLYGLTFNELAVALDKHRRVEE